MNGLLIILAFLGIGLTGGVIVILGVLLIGQILEVSGYA